MRWRASEMARERARTEVRPGARTEARTEARTAVSIAVDRCAGCQACLSACTGGAISLLPGVAAIEVDDARCTGCRRCERACPSRVIRVSGPIRTRHRVVLDGLHDALRGSCPPGWRAVAAEPMLRAVAGADPLAPDLTVLRVPQRGLEWLPLEGPPIALVAEVVSTSSRDRDLGSRRDLYWRCGIPAYWTVDQRSGRVTVQWQQGPAWFDPFAGAVFG